MSAIDINPYGGYHTEQFDKNYNRNNYSTYDANVLKQQDYRDDLIAKDEYGHDYSVGEIDL
jgi:hypothetical protein